MMRLLKVERNLIDEFMEQEMQKKNYENVNKVVKKIKSEGGVNSTAFWELKRRIEGRTQEVAHVIEGENGERIEDQGKILERYKEYFQNLLETKKGETAVEKEAEEIIELTMGALELIDKAEAIEAIPEETLDKIMGGLKKRKAKDLSEWKNEYILAGGEEMKKSIRKIWTM